MGASLYRELTDRLRAAECEFVREGKGSHEIWRSPITGRHFSVPRNIVSQILANTILKQAGLPKAF